MNKLATLALVLAAASAEAQVPVVPPGGGVYTPPPTNLDPGSSGTQAPPQQGNTNPQKPNVVIMNNDGQVVGGDGKLDKPKRFNQSGGGVVPGSGDDDDGYYGGGNGADTYVGAVPELHVVRRGDTLWDICFQYFNDPWQWPKIWSYNPQITNPHWIYPGDLVRLLPRGVFAAGTDSQKLGDPEKPVQKPAVTDNIPPPAKKLEVGIRQLAFVEQSDLDNSVTIDGSVEEKVILGPGDQVYLSYPAGKPPEVGKRYSVYTPGNTVKAKGKDVGSYVHVLGSIEVNSVKQDKRARGTILEATQEIERGAKIGPLLKTFHTVPPAAVKVDAQGSIVAMLHADQLIGQGEVVFIDLGKQSGIEVGNRMFVVRRGDAMPPKMAKEVGQDDRRFPARALGEVVVVEVGDKISVGLITLSVQEMSVGDIVMMQKAQ